jgi:hypothetical protein
MSTPRRELTATVISVNVGSMLSKELAYENIQEVYHTDSTAVLGYINNDARRFQIYVGNGVQHIRDRSKPDQWHHIAGKDNQPTKPLADSPPKNFSKIPAGIRDQISYGRKRSQRKT